MEILQTISYILLFAVATAILYAIGLKKSMTKERDLLHSLYLKSEKKIVNALKNKETMTRNELEKVVEGTKASLFYSKNKLIVKDSKTFIQSILGDMIEKKIIVEEMEQGKKVYRLMKP